MNHSTRRHFLRKSALVTLGAAAATNGIALGDTEAETSLKQLDGDLATILRSYGRTHRLQQAGTEKSRVGAKMKRLPVSRLDVNVENRESFVKSFESLTGLSDRVVVEGNTVRFARDGHYFVIENRVA